MMAKERIDTALHAMKDVRKFLEKIVVSAGVGRASQLPQFGEKILPQVKRDLASLTGQAPETRPARKSIAGFKIREGQIVGIRVTLRKTRMVDFFERFITIVLPRVRDFNGISRDAVDEKGVLNVGIREQFVFPEVNPENSFHVFSLGVTIVPRERVRNQALAGYERLGVPLARMSAKKSH